MVAVGSALAAPPLLFLALFAFAYWRVSLPPEHVITQSTLVCAADATTVCDDSNAMAAFVGDQDRTNVTLAEVAPIAIDAVLATEDRDFYEHAGIDAAGAMRALWNDVRGGETQGGSTITQQYVKNAFLGSEASNRSGVKGLVRKMKEAVLALKLERELSKDQILERYLNTIYFGRGAYGIGTAARVYFGRSIKDVDLAQAAYLAGLIRSPGTADGAIDPARATARRRQVLDALVSVGKITTAQRDEADARPWVVASLPDGSDGTILPPSSRASREIRRGAGTGIEYFLDDVKEALNAKGFSDQEIYGGGLRVFTTLDLEAQQHAWESVTSTLDQPDDPLAALVAIDRDGKVRAMIGGRDHAHDQVNLALGSAGGGSGRQAGSAFKPFTLAAALRQGIPLSQTFPSPNRMVFPKADAGRDWVVSNAEPSSGRLDLTSATVVSSNTVFAQLAMQVGGDKIAAAAKALGITSPMDPVPSLTLGTADVSPFEMADAYASIARGGEHVTPTVITKVVLADGSVVTFDQDHRRAISTDDATRITLTLEQVIERGTGRDANPGVAAAGKTGTTEDHRDAWFVGYLPDGYTTAVWMGYENGPGQPPQTMDRVRGAPVFGGGLPAQIWRGFVAAVASGHDVGTFASLVPPTSIEVPGTAPVTATTDPAATATTTPSTVDARAKVSTTTAPSSPPTTSPTTAPPTTAPSTTSPSTTSPPTTVAPPAANAPP